MTRYKRFKVPSSEIFGKDRLSYYNGGMCEKNYSIITLEEQDDESE